jgi:iron(III) transport system permease protein
MLAAFPLVYVIIHASQSDLALWQRLWTGQIPTLIFNTIKLIITSVSIAIVLGVGGAWIVERVEIPARNLWRWLLALPLAIPAYIAAIALIILFRRGGLLDNALMSIFGFGRGESPLPDIFSLGGATCAIAFWVYPYIFLPVSAALRSMSRSAEEASRLCGKDNWQTFWRVTLPMLGPAIAGGGLLVSLYVLSDFGTVALMRYNTFTLAIFNQFSAQTDRAAASVLSLWVIFFSIVLLWAESRAAQRNRHFSHTHAWKPVVPLRSAMLRWLGLIFVCTLALISIALPLTILGGYALQGWLAPTELDRIWSVGSESTWQHGANSLFISALTTATSTLLAFAPTYLAVRHRHALSRGFIALSKAPFALPGIIAGLSFILFFNRFAPFLYGTVIGLTLAFVLRLLPQSITTLESGIRSVSPQIEHAARVFGCKPHEAFRRVVLPVALPSVMASAALVFLTAMKELPMALLLRPPGFDTLPVRVWAASSESIYSQAAPAACLLILLTFVPHALLISRSFGLDRASDL